MVEVGRRAAGGGAAGGVGIAYIRVGGGSGVGRGWRLEGGLRAAPRGSTASRNSGRIAAGMGHWWPGQL